MSIKHIYIYLLQETILTLIHTPPKETNQPKNKWTNNNEKKNNQNWTKSENDLYIRARKFNKWNESHEIGITFSLELEQYGCTIAREKWISESENAPPN